MFLVTGGAMRAQRQLADIHLVRRRQILDAHPDVRKLEGASLHTCIPIMLIGITHVVTAVALRQEPWWLLLIAAYTIGAVLALGLWTLLHECTHDLVFRTPRSNKWLGIAVALPLIIPAASTFRKCHLLHHKYPNDTVLDGDVPSEWEIRFVGHSAFRKALWLMCAPILQSFRPMRMKGVAIVDKWSLNNLAVQIIFNLLVFAISGTSGFCYLLLSNIFALGFNPLGARWIQEHFRLVPNQETFSYYGWVNKLVFNAGYHVEHHDMMRIPWMRLPKLREAAPEFYEHLYSYRSWTALLLHFLFDTKIDLNRRLR